LVRVAPLIERLRRITALIDIEPEQGCFDALRAAESHGRPLGSDSFIVGLEHRLRRSVRRRNAVPSLKAQHTEMGD
jgi:putative transposase